jgi:predicted ABC-type ATPase
VTLHPARVRLFAGPNGSGKSSIKDRFVQALGERHLGAYLNPDDIERVWRERGGIDFSNWNLEPDPGSLLAFLEDHALIRKRRGMAPRLSLRFEGSVLRCEAAIDSYLASALVDHLRHRLMDDRRDFSFESVMSSPDKVEFLEKARKSGCRTYLYYVATEDAEINVGRVAERVRRGFHGVPEEKIRSRYEGSLELLLPAMRACDRAYLFDNSGETARLVAESSDGGLSLKSDEVPQWFDIHVLKKL